jgi:copper chaperone CopZ
MNVTKSFRVICGLFLACLMSLGSIGAAEPQYAAVLTVKNMCCAKESVPAIKALSKIEGVGRVTVDYKKRLLMIEAKNVVPSPKAMWEVAELVKIEPVRLATPDQVYTSKPLR